MSDYFHIGTTQNATIGATSVSLALDTDTPLVRIVNTGNTIVFVRIGNGPQTATTNDYPIIPNVPQILHKGSADTIAMIATGGGSDPVYVTTGS